MAEEDIDKRARKKRGIRRRLIAYGSLVLVIAGIYKWLLKFSTIAPNFFIDTTDQWDEIRHGLSIHKSQFSGEKLERVSNMVASLHEDDGTRMGTTQAEGFRVVRIHP